MRWRCPSGHPAHDDGDRSGAASGARASRRLLRHRLIWPAWCGTGAGDRRRCWRGWMVGPERVLPRWFRSRGSPAAVGAGYPPARVGAGSSADPRRHDRAPPGDPLRGGGGHRQAMGSYATYSVVTIDEGRRCRVDDRDIRTPASSSGRRTRAWPSCWCSSTAARPMPALARFRSTSRPMPSPSVRTGLVQRVLLGGRSAHAAVARR